jgi:hypothetical protein
MSDSETYTPEADADIAQALPALAADMRANLTDLFDDMVPSMRMLLDEKFFNTAKEIARLMAADTSGAIPKHLRGKPAACFNVVAQAFDWRLGWQFVARHTYETPGGSIGYMGSLIQAILERSGRFIGGPRFEYVGDWKKVTGKFTMRQGRNDKEFPTKAWTAEDADGLGVIVSWQVKGEAEPRYWPDKDFPFWLSQVSTMNSPLWATDPRTQIRYLAIRRFASQAAPSIVGSLPFEADEYLDASDKARDITPPKPVPPRPTREQFADPETKNETQVHTTPDMGDPEFTVVDHVGEIHQFSDGQQAVLAYEKFLIDAEAQRGSQGIQAVWDNNEELRALCAARGWTDVVRAMSLDHARRLVAVEQRERAERERKLEESAMHPNGDIAAQESAQGTSQGTPQGTPQGTRHRAAEVPLSRPQPTQEPQMSADAPPRRNLLWGNPSFLVPPRVTPDGTDNWQWYAATMTALVAEATEPELKRLWADNDHHLQRMAKADPGRYTQVLNRVSAREDELAQDAK